MILSILFSSPLMFFAWITAILIAISVHECAHAFVADRLGDPTAKYAGRVTLNPLAHLDLFGTILLLIVGFGWGKPVPVNPYNLKNVKRDGALISLAGPGANFITAAVFSLALRFFLGPLAPQNMLIQLFAVIIFLNLALMIFNLIPIPPLDGSKILFAFLPSRYEHIRISLERTGPMLLFFLIIMDGVLGTGIFSRILFGGINFFTTILMPGISII